MLRNHLGQCLRKHFNKILILWTLDNLYSRSENVTLIRLYVLTGRVISHVIEILQTRLSTVETSDKDDVRCREDDDRWDLPFPNYSYLLGSCLLLPPFRTLLRYGVVVEIVLTKMRDVFNYDVPLYYTDRYKSRVLILYLLKINKNLPNVVHT